MPRKTTRIFADNIELNTSNFNTDLSGSDSDVQSAMETLDDHAHSSLYEQKIANYGSQPLGSNITLSLSVSSRVRYFVDLSLLSSDVNIIVPDGDQSATVELVVTKSSASHFVNVVPAAGATINGSTGTWGTLSAEGETLFMVNRNSIDWRVDFFTKLWDYSDISANDAVTGITSAELEELSDGSETTLHTHAP